MGELKFKDSDGKVKGILKDADTEPDFNIEDTTPTEEECKCDKSKCKIKPEEEEKE